MRRAFSWVVVSLIALLGLSGTTATAAIYSFDTAGDVVLSSSPSSVAWYPDRYAPQGFVGGATAPDGTTGTLWEHIDASDSLANRPSPYDSAFYNTQGRKLDLPADTTGVMIGLYIPHEWDTLSQSENQGRLASFWGTGVDASNNVSAFPIIEFNNNVDGASTNAFRIWNDFTGTWNVVPGFSGYDQWYQIGFTAGGGNEAFYVNGALVGSVSDPTTTHLANVILQGYNSGNSYDTYWDNLNTAPVPEPATLVMFGVGAAGALVFGRCRKRSGS